MTLGAVDEVLDGDDIIKKFEHPTYGEVVEILLLLLIRLHQEASCGLVEKKIWGQIGLDPSKSAFKLSGRSNWPKLAFRRSNWPSGAPKGPGCGCDLKQGMKPGVDRTRNEAKKIPSWSNEVNQVSTRSEDDEIDLRDGSGGAGGFEFGRWWSLLRIERVRRYRRWWSLRNRNLTKVMKSSADREGSEVREALESSNAYSLKSKEAAGKLGFPSSSFFWVDGWDWYATGTYGWDFFSNLILIPCQKASRTKSQS